MTPDERDRLTKVETKVEGIEEIVGELRDDMKALRSMAENAKGGWATLMIVGGIGTAIGGALVKFVPLVGKGP